MYDTLHIYMYEIIGYLDFEIVVGQFVVISVMVTVVPVAILYNTVAGYILCFTDLMELPYDCSLLPHVIARKGETGDCHGPFPWPSQ